MDEGTANDCTRLLLLSLYDPEDDKSSAVRLLECKANPNHEWCGKPLSFIAIELEKPNTLIAMIECKADIETSKSLYKRASALHTAVRHDNIDCFRILCDNLPDAGKCIGYSKNRQGVTVASSAIEHEAGRCFQEMLRYDVNFTVVDNRGISAVDQAIKTQAMTDKCLRPILQSAKMLPWSLYSAVVTASEVGNLAALRMLLPVLRLSSRSEATCSALAHWASYSMRMGRFRHTDANAVCTIRKIVKKRRLVWTMPLGMAASQNHGDCVRELVKSKASVCFPSINTACRVAVRCGSDECLTSLLPFLSGKPAALSCLVEYAARFNRLKCLQTLIDAKAPLSPDALVYSRNHLLATMLVQAKADPNAPSTDGCFPLSKACSSMGRENLAVIRCLLRLKACPNRGKNVSPLVSAVGIQSPLVCRELILAGADVSSLDVMAMGDLRSVCTPEIVSHQMLREQASLADRATECRRLYMRGWMQQRGCSPLDSFFQTYPGLARFIGNILVTYYSPLDEGEIRMHNADKIEALFRIVGKD